MQKPRVLIDSRTIAARVEALGAQIQADYVGKRLVLVPVLKGSFVFAADLARAINLPLSLDFLGLRSYGSRTETSGIVQITGDLTQPIQDLDVIIVEDIVDTGLTMDYLMENLSTRKPRSLKLAALLHKPSRTRSMVHVDYLGFTIEDVFVVGYGLDHAEQYRNLPYIGVLDQECQS